MADLFLVRARPSILFDRFVCCSPKELIACVLAEILLARLSRASAFDINIWSCFLNSVLKSESEPKQVVSAASTFFFKALSSVLVAILVVIVVTF